MGDTVDALGNKADVKGRAKGAVQERKDTVMSKLGIAGDKVSDATPSGDGVRHGARRAAGIAQENPLGLAVGALAGGFLAGLLIPSAKIEDERIAPMADEVKERAREAGQQAVEHGKEAAQDVAASATEQVQEVAQNTADHAKEAARSTAQEVGDAARQQAGEAGGSGGGQSAGQPAGAPADGRAPPPDQRTLGRGPRGRAGASGSSRAPAPGRSVRELLMPPRALSLQSSPNSGSG